MHKTSRWVCVCHATNILVHSAVNAAPFNAGCSQPKKISRITVTGIFWLFAVKAAGRAILSTVKGLQLQWNCAIKLKLNSTRECVCGLESNWVPFAHVDLLRSASRREILSPPPNTSHKLRTPRPLRGAIARRSLRRDGVRRPAGLVRSQALGRRRRSPRLTKKPCQELADDLRAQAKRLRSLLPRRFPSAGMERGWKRCEDRWRGTYGESGACWSASRRKQALRSC
jgi:hypothetical protein